MIHKSLAISGSKDWSSQRKTVRRVRPDRRTSVRLAPDRRRGIGRRDEDRAEVALSEKRLLAALTKAEAPSDAKDPCLAGALHELGTFYYQLAKYAEAASFHERCLAIRQQILHPTHKDLIQSLNDLARVYYAQGRYAATEPLVKEVVAVREKLHGLHDPNILEALGNYADLLKMRGCKQAASTVLARLESIKAKMP